MRESAFGTLTIRGHELHTETGMFDQSMLRFYALNPRIYSIVHKTTDTPSQEEIQERLLEQEHVRELILDIKRNGGLLEPLVVKPETREVLEGNSRLAAFRVLARENPVKWGLVKCTVLPYGLDDKTIFALLGQYHIKGKKSWQPFEQAGFLYRRHKQHGIDIDQLARELGIKAGEAKLYIDTFEFMRVHDSETSRFSHYLEYLKSRKIRKARENFSGFDDLIVKKIRTGEIARAVDIRDLLPKITAGPPKILQKFAAGTVTFGDAVDKVVDSGADSSVFRRLNKFRMWLASADVGDALSDGSPEECRRVLFELDKIAVRAKSLLGKK